MFYIVDNFPPGAFWPVSIQGFIQCYKEAILALTDIILMDLKTHLFPVCLLEFGSKFISLVIPLTSPWNCLFNIRSSQVRTVFRKTYLHDGMRANAL